MKGEWFDLGGASSLDYARDARFLWPLCGQSTWENDASQIV